MRGVKGEWVVMYAETRQASVRSSTHIHHGDAAKFVWTAEFAAGSCAHVIITGTNIMVIEDSTSLACTWQQKYS